VSQLLSRAEKELCTLAATEEKGGDGSRFRPMLTAILISLSLS
jgi:hypothetical protein